MKQAFIFSFAAIILSFACSDGKKQLRHYGIPVSVNGTDTVWPQIPHFSFVDQDSQIVNNETFKNQIYVADFFFTHCPTICPKVKKQMLRLYKKYENDDRIALLSHTIDQAHDTVGRLKFFADQLGVKSPKWRFVTGERDSIYAMPPHYMSIVMVDKNAPGGYNHSGYLILIDKDRYIRSYCDGTDAKSVDGFMKDIDLLLEEQSPKQ